MNKKIITSYVVIACLCIIFFVVSHGLTGEKVYSYIDDTDGRQIQPYEIEQVDQDTKVYYFSMTGEHMNTLAFLSMHQNVRVWADDMLLFVLNTGDRAWTQTTGASWNIIPFPVGASDLKIELEAVYPSGRNMEMSFYAGNSGGFLRHLVRQSFFEIIICVANAMVGLILLFYWFFLCRGARVGKAPLYLGLFAFLVGFWALFQTNYAIAIFNRRSLLSLGCYIVFMLWTVPFLLFVKEYYEPKRKWFADALCAISLISVVVDILLHAFGIWALKETLPFTHVLMLCAVGYFVYSALNYIRLHGLNRKSRVNIVASIILVVSAGTDFFFYYTNRATSQLAGRIGLLLYICIIGGETMMESVKQIDQGKRALLYKEMAETDAMTRLGNRHAYVQWEREHARTGHCTIVNLDLNNLKHFNDTMGHAVGDKYIEDAAALIREIFGGIGKCFRIGGDEFCVGIDRIVSQNEFENLYESLKKMEEHYNSTSKDVFMQIACGYACFDERFDSDIEDTKSRADARMYENKKLLKDGNDK